jgi:methionyl-tRNA formyltransferase
MKKILLFIATEKGFEVLKKLYKYDKKIIGLVSSFQEEYVKEEFYYKIEEFCNEKQISFKEYNKEFKQNLESILKAFNITEAVAISWRYFIPLKINKLLETKLIIFHDSLLPKYRGFCPTPTAIICGEKEIGISVFFATNEIDKGEIILQKKIKIDTNLYIKDIILKQSKLYSEAMIELIEMIRRGSIRSELQDETKATYSIWRNPEDCQIDWNLSSFEIYNLIRAVSFPYMGAFTYYEGEKVYILKSEIVKDIKFLKRNPGKIWKIDKKMPIVVCGKGMIKLIKVKDKDENEISFNFTRRRFSNI